LLLTGPNMAGKSTLMRQVALTSILAQMGSFVPAREASLPMVDRIFTRIGASDHLSEGLSTFMVEMKETAEVLKWATQSSLVIMDEIGRGTSTYDGMSLAQSILEYLVTDLGATCLFATHYHELTALEGEYPRLHNFHMGVQERDGDIRFLHVLQKGPSNKSYGIHVARLAGLPQRVLKRSQILLKDLESKSTEATSQMNLFSSQEVNPEEKLDNSLQNEIIENLRGLSIDEITPVEALNRIAEWQRHLF
ncbi:MAG: DNA mismatch repair protein MutS, partial [Bdellovibrionales bacterium]|nr:DNA mismatch repair protein MutS [Bdellovibrionales bacterium]